MPCRKAVVHLTMNVKSELTRASCVIHHEDINGFTLELNAGHPICGIAPCQNREQ